MFEEYNGMSLSELQKKLKKLSTKAANYNSEIKTTDRAIKKPCWWVLIIPLFGLFIFNSMVNKRKANTDLGLKLTELKTNQLYIELEIKFIEQQISKQETKSNTEKED